jgi:hypothetical protein
MTMNFMSGAPPYCCPLSDSDTWFLRWPFANTATARLRPQHRHMPPTASETCHTAITHPSSPRSIHLPCCCPAPATHSYWQSYRCADHDLRPAAAFALAPQPRIAAAQTLLKAIIQHQCGASRRASAAWIQLTATVLELHACRGKAQTAQAG